MSRKQVEVNYLYFGGFLLVILLTSASAIFSKIALSGARPFFFFYATGQAVFEVLAFIFLGSLIRYFLGYLAAMAFMGATFVFLLLHLLDFCMDRILDLSIWETLDFVFDESWHNFLYLLDASGIPLWVWGILFALLAIMPLIGIVLHSWTERLARLRPLRLRPEWLFQAFLCIPAALLFWEYSASRALLPDSYTSFLQSLPWKWTFLQPKIVQYPIPGFLTPPASEHDLLAAIDRDQTQLAQLPNIYFLIVESLREDFIRPEIAPALSQFKQESIHFEHALSNANGSHPSWFSIFHSQFAFAWKHVQSIGWKMGSPSLALLKKWGYKVRLYSSAQLNYYSMEELLFGENKKLIDSYHPFHHAPPLSAAQSDAKTLTQWKHDLAENPDLKTGQVIIFFWDSTHFNYSWPDSLQPKFTPISNNIDYFNLFQSQNKIEKIKNRYRNAVCYIDSLFGDFVQALPDKDNAIVIFTGDHGEEFFERGHLFHGSHLSREQTHIPLYMKFGQRKVTQQPSVISQMDIFPSVLHHLSAKEVLFLEGKSIFGAHHWPFAILSRFNAGRTPYEFCLHNGRYKLIARFNNRRNIFQSQMLQIRSLWDKNDRSLNTFHNDVEQWMQAEFGPGLDRLFKSSNSLFKETNQAAQEN